ncbi:cupin domain-containing protein [Pendulispora brunnea]|uniref:Cupin domain-containing protein n=1 Tax=Pendulispora brunnea TaxID=2905690 RepID=A0ABZ2K8A7_9BACT
MARMSLFTPIPNAVVVRAAEAEVVGRAPTKVQLLADSSATGGALSTVRVTLENGADGARPHHHTKSAEMFYVLDGSVQLLAGTNVVMATRGDLVVVPPRTAHAFAAARGKSADLLIVLAPAVERFEYFRHLARIAFGDEPPETLADLQQLYDNYFQDSPEWKAARA